MDGWDGLMIDRWMGSYSQSHITIQEKIQIQVSENDVIMSWLLFFKALYFIYY